MVWQYLSIVLATGELDFKESFRQRMRLLKGFKEKELAEIAATLPVTEGAPRLISNLKRSHTLYTHSIVITPVSIALQQSRPLIHSRLCCLIAKRAETK